jgi:benzoyl-CoA reductase/2-hydroxyglutaryl-CoA dehydratase subunit BcrC/BadD/HgdB
MLNHFKLILINNKGEKMKKMTIKKASFIVSEYANDPIKETNDFLNYFKDQVDLSVEQLENYIGFKLNEDDLLMVGL